MFSAEQQPAPETPRSPLRSVLPYTTVITIVVALYVAWTMYSRYSATRDAAEAARAKAAAAEQQRNALITQHGELSFTTFYASDAAVRPGQSTQLCYGVMNADSVTLDPPVEPVKPTERHCMEIAPKATTTYTITAKNSAGQSKSLSLTVRVKP